MIENRGVVLILRPYNRFPSKFQNFERHCRNSSLFLINAFLLKILKTCLGAYRSLFLVEKSNAARNFSIEDWVHVAGSQKSLKVGEKISVEEWKIMVLSKWAFFFSSSSFALFRENCHGSLSLAYFHGKSSSNSKFQYIKKSRRFIG